MVKNITVGELLDTKITELVDRLPCSHSFDHESDKLYRIYILKGDDFSINIFRCFPNAGILISIIAIFIQFNNKTLMCIVHHYDNYDKISLYLCNDETIDYDEIYSFVHIVMMRDINSTQIVYNSDDKVGKFLMQNSTKSARN